MRKVRIVSGAVLVLFALYILISLPGMYRRDRAESFAQFAAKGVNVKTAGLLPESGNSILVPTGVGLLLAGEFEFANDRGEKRSFILCNGHPDYWKLVEATPSKERRGRRVKLVFSTTAVVDKHSDENHLGFTRYLRVELIPAI